MLWLLQVRMVKCTIRIYFNMINTYHKSFGKVFGIGLIFDNLELEEKAVHTVYTETYTHIVFV